MGRKRLQPGDPCRYGHPWNRTADGKRCLDCYPVVFSPEARRVQEARRREVVEQVRERQTERLRHLRANTPDRILGKRGLNWMCTTSRRLRLAGGNVSTADLHALLERQRNCCALTGLPLAGMRPHLDHIVPIADGGTSDIDNVQWVHPMANAAKGSKTVSEFHAWLLAAADSVRKILP